MITFTLGAVVGALFGPLALVAALLWRASR